MKLSIEIDDNELNEAVTKGIKGLSDETITDLAKGAISEYLTSQRGIDSVLYEKRDSYYREPRIRDEVYVMLKNSFTPEEVAKYRAMLFNVLEHESSNLLVAALAKSISDLMCDSSFKEGLSVRLNMLANRIGADDLTK